MTTWPEKPTCHDSDYQAQRFAPQTWRPKGEKLHPSHDLPMVFRTCSYCGSIHPEDLLEALRAGATLSGADWKYGWPHKFYVGGIPNTNAGQRRALTCIPLTGAEPTAAEMERASHYLRDPKYTSEVRQNGFDPRTGAPKYQLAILTPEGPTTNGKWYNEHFLDLTSEAMSELADAIYERAGVQFRMVDGKLMYATAPRG